MQRPTHTATPLLSLTPTKTVVLCGGSEGDLRDRLLNYFHQTYDLYEKLFEPLLNDGFYRRADRLRHPLIFYYCHTACFFINKMILAKLISVRINCEFESLFAIGVDEMSWDDLLPDHYQWPALSEVQQYRNQTRDVVDQVIRTHPLTVPLTWHSPLWAIVMGIEHERIHLETSAVLIRQLNLKYFKPETNTFWRPYLPQHTILRHRIRNELISVLQEKKTVTLGRPHDDDDNDLQVYGWDVEYGKHECEVMPFRASKYLVTNADYFEFLLDGGYHNPTYWDSEGQRYRLFKEKENQLHPVFWVAITNNNGSECEYKLRLMLEEIEMQWDWPVEVNYLEAKAYTNWLSMKTHKSLRLPTEEEYYIMRSAIQTDQPTWGKAPGNINLEYFSSSTPVDYFPPTSTGLYDVIGNVWQHTETQMDAFKGFRTHPLYEDFSVPTFDTQHNMIMGGSWISTGNLAIKFARYAFRRHFHQFAGFRYVESMALPQDEKNENVNEEDSDVNTESSKSDDLPSFGNITSFSPLFEEGM
jgi:5-histidylcysteine sulfoxide synthase